MAEAETSSDTVQILGGLSAVTREEAESGAHKWYFLSLVVMIYVTSSMDRMVISVIAEPLKAAFHLSDKQIGLLNVAFSIACGVAVLPMGWMIDRVNRRALLSAAVTIWSVLTSTCAFSSSFTALILARMGVGVGEAPMSPAALSMIADTFPVTQRNTAVGFYNSGTNAAQLVVFTFGGLLLMHFDWRAVFLVAGGPGLVLAALFFFTTREPKRGAFDRIRPEAQVSVAPPAVRDAIRGIFGNTALCYAILALTLASGASYSFILWTTSFLVRAYGLSVSHGAIGTGIGLGLCATIGSLLVGPFADQFSKGNVRKVAMIAVVSAFLTLVGGLVMVLDGTLAVSLAGLALMAVMTGFYVSTGYSLILSLAPPEIRGTTLAVAKLSFMLIGDGSIPFLTGVISDAIGGRGSIRLALLCTLTATLVAVILYGMIYRILSRREMA